MNVAGTQQKLGLIAIAIAMIPAFVQAQGIEGKLCRLPGTPNLKTMIATGTVDRLETFAGNYALWASSFLAPSGKAPVPSATQNDDAQMAYQETLVKWSCQYDPDKAQGSKPETAWVEGVPGDGIGETLVVQVNTRSPVRIWSSYGKSPALHTANSRPRRVCVHVLQTMHLPNDNQVGAAFDELRVLASAETELRDFNGFQPLPLPSHKVQAVKTTSGEFWPLDDSRYDEMTFVAIEILSIYPGTKYQDTAISEVSNGAVK